MSTTEKEADIFTVSNKTVLGLVSRGELLGRKAPLECVIQNAHHPPWVRVKVMPYYARLNEEPFAE